MNSAVRTIIGGLQRAQWYLYGFAVFALVLFLPSLFPFRHVATPADFHEIGWAYITLVIAVMSLLYPLALSLRESLTSRLFGAFDKFIAHSGEGTISLSDQRYLEFDRTTSAPVRQFRKAVFDRQLPLLVSFSAASLIRVLACLLGIGPMPIERQMLEPQLYVFVYISWAGWVTLTVLRFRPFFAVETAEARYRGLPPLDSFSSRAPVEPDDSPGNGNNTSPQSSRRPVAQTKL